MSKGDVVIYESKDGSAHLNVRLESETVWLTQAQMARLFGIKPQAISKHISNIYDEDELKLESTCSIMKQVETEDSHKVRRNASVYNLERVNYSDIPNSTPRRYPKASRHMPTTMGDWEKRIDSFLALWDQDVLQGSGSVTADEAKLRADTEFEKYRITQDRLFESDFDRYFKHLEESMEKDVGDEQD